MLPFKSSARRKIAFFAGICSLPFLLAAGQQPESSREKDRLVTDDELDRTRRQVRMLDDIYKGGIVLITQHYVNEEDDLAAGSAFQKLFAIAKDKGWHEVRLLDATGDPYETDNVPRDGFEKDSVAKLLDGQTFVEKVVEKDGKRFLLATTPIPVVMDKCVMCHDHYADVPAGKPIGALSYRVPIVE